MMFQRTKLLIGEEKFNKIKNSHICIFGLGGVGGYLTESLVRSGIGEITIIDFDVVDITNLNRQIIATNKTIGMLKVDATEERMLSINENLKINKYPEKITRENINIFFENKNYDYVVDVIDLVSSKISLIKYCKENDIPIISSMGAGNKLDPSLLEITCISKTFMCPLAKVIRKELRNLKIEKLKVLYSKEIPIRPENLDNSRVKSKTVGSISFVPAVAGLLISGEIIKDIINK
jgi:tRNA A37 threonylcarbamoyladenosine dehydratase